MKKIFVPLLAGALLSVSLDACSKGDAITPSNRTPASQQTLCTVDFDMGDGTVVASQKVAPGGSIFAPESPTRDGYTLVGWTKDLAGDNPWNFSENTVHFSMILYAKWSKN